MRKTPLFVVLACLVLAGCFRSKSLLLDLAQAGHPLADGTWVGDDEDKVTVTLTARGNAYLMVEGDSRNDLVLAPIAGRENAWAAAQADEGCAEHADTCDWEYAVVIIDGDKAREFAPNCETDWAAISNDVASRNEAGDTCYFERADGLQSALAKVVDRGGTAITYTRN